MAQQPIERQEPGRQLILAGGGHSHALVLRMWAMNPRRRPPACHCTLVSRQPTALYSGMVPGLVAGHYQRHDCAIDLEQLCRRAGVTFIRAEISGLDTGARQLVLEGRPPLRYDLLSLNLGAITALPPGAAAEGGRAQHQPVKPLEPFLTWCEALEPGASVSIRGGGAAAVELALALRSRGARCRLLLRGRELHLGSPAANRLGERLLAEAGIAVDRETAMDAAADLLCTGSRAPAWLAAAGLPVEAASGRVRTDASLAVPGHPGLFACGDCALIEGDPRPAAGVWAVRAAPVLATNIRRWLSEPDRPLRRWRPQARALQLLGEASPPQAAPAAAGLPGAAARTGRRGARTPRAQPPRAVAFWGPLAIGPSRWLWLWKERIDRRFMARFTALGSMAAAPADAMACRGCAAKLAADPLSGALARLAGGAAPPPAEDAAELLTLANGDRLLQSVDGFPALLGDPWRNARLSTLHACSDLWACGAAVESAQALVTIPAAAAGVQEELLLQTLAGVRSVLDPLGARLIGGHTLEGRDGAGLAVALTVTGLAPADRFWPKGPLRTGEALVLTRAIGSGVLFAAAAAGAARPEWIEAALTTMETSQAALVELLAAHGCRACTDITGFGLLGHLGEMLAGAAPGTRVQLDAAAIPALEGALELLERGFASTLAPANAQALALLDGPVELVESEAAAGAGRPARRALLIDPQTCGPLLAALPAERADAAVAALQRAGFSAARRIAQVTAV
ncbi:MAG: selenide, water dikinase SelD [Cyanobacteriota bacterium]|nr:selenide, water dikinase SelD [Cyanobacteriota bacterium]